MLNHQALAHIPRQLTKIVLLVFLLIGCFFVAYPFLSATLFAAVVVISTWTPYSYISQKIPNHKTLSAFAMVLILILLVLVPLISLVVSATQSIDVVRIWLQQLIETGLSFNLPSWVTNLPFIGKNIENYWLNLINNRQEMLNLANQLSSPVSKMLFVGLKIAGEGVLQFSLVIFISFFLYRDGDKLALLINQAAKKISGKVGLHLITMAKNTISGVTIGLAGTSFGQGLVAAISFFIVSAPAPLVLSMAVFMLSVVPIGPPLIWGSVAAWLYFQGKIGLAIFQVIWGVLVISSVDNFVKPMLISRSAQLPLLLIAIGVFGGFFAFGFIGMFLGPTLLAVAYVLFNYWLEIPAK